MLQGKRWSLFSFALSPGVIPHGVHEACKCVIWTAGDNCCAFLVFKPLKPTFDFSSALSFALIPSGRNRELCELGEGRGEGNHGVLLCLINHANQWWGVRGPLTCSETPETTTVKRAQAQWSTSRRWGGKSQKTGGKLRSETPVLMRGWGELTKYGFISPPMHHKFTLSPPTHP